MLEVRRDMEKMTCKVGSEDKLSMSEKSNPK